MVEPEINNICDQGTDEKNICFSTTFMKRIKGRCGEFHLFDGVSDFLLGNWCKAMKR